MPVPDFQSLMLPFLQFSADGAEHTPREALESLAKTFNLTDSDRGELLPSGTQRVFDNRVAWTKTHLLKAGLLESPRRSYFKITQRGHSVLEQNLLKINQAFLRQFPEYLAFSRPATINPQSTPTGEFVAQHNVAPQEVIEQALQQLRQVLIQELLTKVKSSSWQFFEDLVVQLLLKMGYGGSFAEAGQVTQRTKDGGIDGIINEDILGLDKIYIQAKKLNEDTTVGQPVIQSFAGAMGNRTNKGVFITTSRFTQSAKDYVKFGTDKKIVLIDGEQLANYMIDYNLGVTVQQTYEIKRMDNDYFGE
jgi:restriction system protein